MSVPANIPRLDEGDFLGSYRVVRHVARGSHWDVYLARSGSEKRRVALKVALGSWADADTLLDRARLVRELEHPHVARLFDAGHERGLLYIAQEFISDQRGTIRSLADELRNYGGALPEERVRVLAKQLIEGVAGMHGFAGGGMVHGHLTPDDVLFNEQSRAKIINAGLYESADAEQRAADLRVAGALIHSALTGQAWSELLPLVPVDGEMNPRWQRFLRPLLQASPEAMPDLGAKLDEILLFDTEPRSLRRWLLPLAAAGLLIPAVLFTVLLVRARRARDREAVAAAIARQAAAREEAIAAAMKAAAKARARADFDKARKILTEARRTAPNHRGLAEALADVQMTAGLAGIRPDKEKAENGWKAVREVDPGQELGELLTQLEGLMTAARGALAEQAFDQAAELYRKAATLAENIRTLDRERGKATAIRQEAGQAREEADAENAAEFAGKLWQEAQRLDHAAEEQFGAHRFNEAVDCWKDAVTVYRRARDKAAASRRVTGARNAFESAVVAAGEATRNAIPVRTLQEVTRLRAEAEESMAAEKWDEAAACWDKALTAFRRGVAEADVILRERHFSEALAMARTCFSEQRYAAAEQALNEALNIEGYANHGAAKALLKKVRALKERQGAQRRRTRGNLVLNGNFAVGQGGAPVGWTRPDNLTVFWVDGGVSGKCIHMDTDVYRSEWEEHRKHPDVPMKKTPTSGTRYDTVGGTVGVAIYCYPIRVEPGAYYRVRYDVRGRGEPFLYIKGYWKAAAEHLKDMGEKIFFKPVPGGPSFSLVAYGTSGEEKRYPQAGDFIQSFRRRVVARFPKGETGWRRFETVLQLPPDRPIQVVLLELYAYWPPGDYWFDNVVMEEVSRKDFQAYQARRKRLGKEANFGVPVP